MRTVLKLSAHDRLGYEGHRRRRLRLRREYDDGYGGAWLRWNYNYNYWPSHDSSDEWIDYDRPRSDQWIDYDRPDSSDEWADYDRPEYDRPEYYGNYGWRSQAYLGRVLCIRCTFVRTRVVFTARCYAACTIIIIIISFMLSQNV